MGRRKIEIKRIENSEARHVTFCKRRMGLLKKLSELCIVCGGEAAALIYSPGGKVHIFGHPDAGVVFTRFLSGTAGGAPLVPEAAERESALSAMCDETEAMFQAEKAGRRWWEEGSLDELDSEKLHRLRCLIEELRQAVIAKVEKLQPGTAADEANSASSAGSLAPPWPELLFVDDRGFLQRSSRY